VLCAGQCTPAGSKQLQGQITFILYKETGSLHEWFCLVRHLSILCCSCAFKAVLFEHLWFMLYCNCCTVCMTLLLCCAVLCCAVLCCAVLCCAVLCCAVLSCAVHHEPGTMSILADATHIRQKLSMLLFSLTCCAAWVLLQPFGMSVMPFNCQICPWTCLACLSSCLWGLQDTNKVLAISRIMVAWQPLGLAMGTYDMCNRYLQQRQQFGSPLAAFQVLL